MILGGEAVDRFPRTGGVARGWRSSSPSADHSQSQRHHSLLGRDTDDEENGETDNERGGLHEWRLFTRGKPRR